MLCGCSLDGDVIIALVLRRVFDVYEVMFILLQRKLKARF